MMKLKLFIDKLPIDKKGHIIFGLIVNPIIILPCVVIGILLNLILIGILVGVLSCIVFHIGIEYWQKRTGKGKFERLDAFAGYSSALYLGLLLTIITIINV